MRLMDVDNYCKNICLCNRELCDKEKCSVFLAPTIDAVPVEVLATIAYYNGHLDWLRDLAEKLEQMEEGERYINPVPTNEWCGERHIFWESLVGMFGDWGTSIRSGWIEKTKEAAAFIKKLIEAEGKE